VVSQKWVRDWLKICPTFCYAPLEKNQCLKQNKIHIVSLWSPLKVHMSTKQVNNDSHIQQAFRPRLIQKQINQFILRMFQVNMFTCALQISVGIWKCWFLRRTNNKLNPQSRSQTQVTLVGGECSHHCAIPAPMIAWLAWLCTTTVVLF